LSLRALVSPSSRSELFSAVITNTGPTANYNDEDHGVHSSLSWLDHLSRVGESLGLSARGLRPREFTKYSCSGNTCVTGLC
jgi:hypothetical protein